MENIPKFTPNPNMKLMDQVRQIMRYHHYAINTEKTYCKWILMFISHFGAHRHPRSMGAKEVETFLSHLATTRKISAATQRQALNAIIFLYKQVLDIEINDKIAPVRAKRRPRLPVVMSPGETRGVLNQMRGQHLSMSELLRGRFTADGVRPTEGQQCRYGSAAYLRPVRQRGKRPRGSLTPDPCWETAGTTGGRAADSCDGRGRRLR